MKRKIIFIIFLFLLLAQIHTSSAQLTPKEITERPKWEEFLKTAEIVRHKDIGEGITRPIRLFLKAGDFEGSGCWKNPSGIQQGYLEGWKYEIAAYEMDKLLELNMIPVTVEKRFNGKKGSLQLWVEDVISLLDILEKKIQFPKEKIDHYNKTKYIARAFDSLIANEDRTQQNMFYTKDWRLILIDHSRSFRSARKFTKKLMFGKNGIRGVKLIRQLPKAFVENIKALNFDNIQKAVGPYLKKKEIEAILKRKKLLLKEIEEMIKEKGEENVLY
ncbi:MAG: hypothetical protein JSV96_07515 [Candidatus Aminicenantes bacterium]|nr:MAG: hypothetical protein JSV96_07515 [Candidatus Aminicenantes bacterium]